MSLNTCSYHIPQALNPIIVCGLVTTVSYNSVFYATALSAGIFTFLMGAVNRVPLMLAPGMGLNAYFAVTCATGFGKLSFQQGLAGVLISGLIYLFLTFTGLRFILFKAVPKSLRHATTAGIGWVCGGSR